ncbi:MAG: CopG family ribbon-helix-helix protein [Bryobacteraceae bacterium]
MEVFLTPEQEAQLELLAVRVQRPKSELVNDAIGSYLEYDRWVHEAREKVEIGYRQALRGELIDGEESRRRLRQRRNDSLQKRG